LKRDFSHKKNFNKWLNNANPWILSASRCNHDLKFTVAFGKDSKSLIYYIIDYITKTFIYTSHMYSLLQIAIQFLKKIETQIIITIQSTEVNVSSYVL